MPSLLRSDYSLVPTQDRCGIKHVALVNLAHVHSVCATRTSGVANAAGVSAVMPTRVLQTILPRVNALVEEFHAGKPAGHEPAAADTGMSNKPVVTDHTRANGNANAADGPAKGAASKKGAASSGGARRSGQTIELTEKFYASARPCRVIESVLQTRGSVCNTGCRAVSVVRILLPRACAASFTELSTCTLRPCLLALHRS